MLIRILAFKVLCPLNRNYFFLLKIISILLQKLFKKTYKDKENKKSIKLLHTTIMITISLIKVRMLNHNSMDKTKVKVMILDLDNNNRNNLFRINSNMITKMLTTIMNRSSTMINHIITNQQIHMQTIVINSIPLNKNLKISKRNKKIVEVD